MADGGASWPGLVEGSHPEEGLERPPGLIGHGLGARSIAACTELDQTGVQRFERAHRSQALVRNPIREASSLIHPVANLKCCRKPKATSGDA
jgi:hypothetical protein